MSTTNFISSEKRDIFQCSSCPKSFTRKDYLYRHEKNHADVKPFKCERCNLFFTRSDLLAKHFKSKSHQRVKNNVSDVLRIDNDRTHINDSNNVNHKEVTHQIAKRNYEILESSLPSRMNEDFFNSNSFEQNQLNTEHKSKKFKRLGIASFLNRHSNEDKIPAPPPQPSIILPATPNINVNDKSLDPTNRFVKHPQDKGKAFQIVPNLYNNEALHRNNFYLKPPLEQQDQSSNSNYVGKIPPYNNDGNSTGNIEDDLVWLFNDNTPGDNLLWLFSEVSPIENGNRPYESSDSNKSSIVSNLYANDQEPNDLINNGVDIASMYQNLYNETTNTNINNNKVNMTGETRSRIIGIFPSVTQLNKVTLERFEEYLDLYWFNFAQTFPIIHQATFNPNTVDIYLLISMIVIGMAHSLDKIEYKTSIELNKKFRPVIYSVVGDSTEIPLPLMQALILHNFSAKNFGDTQLSKIAQIDHGSNVMYLKFSGFLNNLTEPIVFKPKEANLSDLTEQWQSWIYYESCKRAVFFEFICDTQHVTFSKIRSLSSFDIRLELPCTDEVWNCADPVKFFEEYQKQPVGIGTGIAFDPSLDYSKMRDINNYPRYSEINDNSNNLVPINDKAEVLRNEDYLGNLFNLRTQMNNPDQLKVSSSNLSLSIKMLSKWPTFLWSLKSMMGTYKANQKDYPLECYSLFSRYIILHGLLRICWDMRGQNLLDLGFVSNKKLGEFFKKLENGFLNWKGNFDLHVKLYEKQVQSSVNGDGSDLINKNLILSLNNYGPTNASWANISFFYTGLFCLYADITSVTVFAAEYKNFQSVTRQSTYKGIKEMEYERNELIIEQWARSIYGKLALVEACKFLRLVHGNEETINTFSHIPQTVYLAALIVWCYEIKRHRLNDELINKGRHDELNSGKLDLNASKYFDLLGNIHYGLSKRDAWEYFSMILDLESNDILDELNDNQENVYEEFKKRQMNTIGVVCYVLHLLRNCKWVYSIDLVQQLEHVIITYDKY